MAGSLIGIVPKANLFKTNFYNEDIYAFVNNYGKRIAQAGGCPIGLIPVDGILPGDDRWEKQLEQCDGFVFSGGARIMPYHIQVLDHALRTGKKVLGICMGMQVIHTYFIVKDHAKERNVSCGDAWQINAFYDRMKRERYMFTEPVEHHWDIDPTEEHMQEAKHRVQVERTSQLYGILQEKGKLQEEGMLRAVTMHHYRITKPSQQLTISARAEDGTIEGLEYGKNIIGVQFHPEAEEELIGLFQWLVKRDLT